MRLTFPLGRRLFEITINLVARERPKIPVRFPPPLNLEIYEAFRKYVQHEDNLVNQRITWMLLIHGFLYGAYAITLKQKYDIIKDAYYSDTALAQTELFMAFIAIIGFIISYVAFRSINAAKRAAVNVQQVFEGQYIPRSIYGVPGTVRTGDGLTLPTIAGGGDRNNRLLGILSARRLPLVLMAGWAVAFAIDVWYSQGWWFRWSLYLYHVMSGFLSRAI